MTLRTIVTLPDPVLKRKARAVTRFDKDLHTLLDDMVETMREAPGVGLAAPQIGLDIQFAVIDVTDTAEPLTFLRVDGEDTPMEEMFVLK